MKKIVKLIIGINVYAISINFLQSLNLGMGSFDSLTLEIQHIFNIKEFGNASFLLHFFFFLILLIFMNKYKMDVKMVLLSILSVYILTRFVNLYSLFNLKADPSIGNAVIIIIILNLGLYLIASTNLIIAPFDKFIVETSIYLKVPIGKVRVFFDILLLICVVALNMLLSIDISITIYTLIITFATGVNIFMYEVIFKKLGYN